MNFDQAVAIMLQYDVMPSQLLNAGQKAALQCAKDVVRDHAQRAVSSFFNHEISKKYVGKPCAGNPDKLVVINEVHDHHHENDLACRSIIAMQTIHGCLRDERDAARQDAERMRVALLRLIQAIEFEDERGHHANGFCPFDDVEEARAAIQVSGSA